jgi:uncharacterized membrane protein
MTPAVTLHLITALGALVLGPVVIWARLGTAGSPVPRLWHRVHRVLGLTWVGLMIITALSALFIRSGLPNLGGFSPIHLLVPFTLYSLYAAFRYLRKGNITGHRRTLIGLYIGACVVAGAFTLLPGRFLGQMVWGDWLGWL